MSSASSRIVGALSAPRLERRVSDLAEFGARSDGGVDRLALTQEEFAARRHLVEPFVARPGYVVGMDDAANLFVRRLGADSNAPPILIGSHIDTQPAGGRYDGAFGVCAGFEILEAFDGACEQTRLPVEVVVWNNEEGVRFSPGLTGSAAFVDPSLVGRFASLVAADGVTMVAARDEATRDMEMFLGTKGGRLQKYELARPVGAYIEAHVEQGPVLESESVPVGCVAAIQAVRWIRIVVNGRSAHAGTTPHSRRDDAMVKAVALANEILFAREAFDDDLRLTIGRWDTTPNAVNTIAGRVCFTVDMRHPNEAVLAELETRLARLLPSGSEMTTMFREPTAPFDTHLTALLAQACDDLGIKRASVLSGAFHDAINLSRHCPSAMLFAPSVNGISHHPDEYTAGEDLFCCVQAQALAVARLAGNAVDKEGAV